MNQLNDIRLITEPKVMPAVIVRDTVKPPNSCS
jgi:hypothetical protein